MPWPKPILEEFGLWPVWGAKGGATAAAADVADVAVAAADDDVAMLEAMPREAAVPPETAVPADAAGPVDDFPVWASDDADDAADAALWSIMRQEADAPAQARPSLDTLDWDALAERVANCRDCGLCEKRTQTVFGVGDRRADWLLVGEAPGQQEDLQGEPFVGQAGKLLDNMLRAVALQRGENVYIANVLKCRPPNNRDPAPQEVASCEPYLKRQVALLKPRVIVVMGRFAAQSILRSQASIASLRGRVHEYEGVPVIVTYHPAYLLRSLADKSKAWTDWCLARATYESICTRTAAED
ncbi:uracil-DNA glycosylase [Pandoraea terrae]|uniref:Type-4 uracil-DNA glycosylase n=1 Tax=Pandoraea terrae TaxID=1537710 RepID=A0A5E4WQQ1_9BURK|nr:uracil-DNA glycosylase [Pandoraea terrae]VVE27092.1 uracil-DNA glycosylase [Pandoraea terrae]